MDHLVRVYPGHGDTLSPVPWAELAASLLDSAGPEVTRRLLLEVAEAGCIGRADLPAT